jgi:predicted DNA-binding transcriptional regulator AlpA
MTTPRTTSDDHTRSDHAHPLLVDVAKAATILAISRSSIYQLIWTEQLVPVRIDRSVRFSMAQLEQFVADRTAEGGVPHDR